MIRAVSCIDMKALRGYRFASVRDAARALGIAEGPIYHSIALGTAAERRYVFKRVRDYASPIRRGDDGRML